MGKKILLIVDAQYDFINGSLAVNGAEEKMNLLAEYIEKHSGEFTKIIFTCDWHPSNHCSFSEWPVHCVQHTKGAAIYQPLIDAATKAVNKQQYVEFLTKGDFCLKEEYSIMENPTSSEYLLRTLKFLKDEEIQICGIANEYCVNNTVKDLAKVEYIKPRICLLKDFIAAISDETVVYTTAKENGLKVS